MPAPMLLEAQFTDLEAGRQYLISPIAPTCTVVKDQGLFGPTQDQLVLVEDSEIAEVEINLILGGVITGRVTLVRAVSEKSEYHQLYLFREFKTDDRGVYRIFGILAGKYGVGVGDNLKVKGADLQLEIQKSKISGTYR